VTGDPSAERGPGGLSGWRRRALILSVVLSAIAYLAVALWSGWREVAQAVAQVGLVGVMIALALSLLNYGLRFVRWQAYLRALGHPVRWRTSLRIYLAGFALTTTPGKTGEALRGVFLKPLGVPYPVSLAAFLSERLSDLLAVLLLTLFGLTAHPSTAPMIAVGVVGLTGAFAMLSSARLLEALRDRLLGFGRETAKTLRPRRLLAHGFEILLQARRCHAPTLLLSATLLSAVAWAAEAWAFDLILRWMGIDVPLSFAVFVYAISMLAGALSMMPGGLGGAEAAMVALLMLEGVQGPDAVAATVLIRLATLWFAVAIGAVVLGSQPGRPDVRTGH
jgi:uncharacterized membrane protein YbhN (UPF0104 family)